MQVVSIRAGSQRKQAAVSSLGQARQRRVFSTQFAGQVKSCHLIFKGLLLSCRLLFYSLSVSVFWCSIHAPRHVPSRSPFLGTGWQGTPFRLTGSHGVNPFRIDILQQALRTGRLCLAPGAIIVWYVE